MNLALAQPRSPRTTIGGLAMAARTAGSSRRSPVTKPPRSVAAAASSQGVSPVGSFWRKRSAKARITSAAWLSFGAALHPVVGERPYDKLLTKDLPSTFAGTDFGQWLKEKQIDTVVIVGYMTHNCDASTIYEASHKGLSVELASRRE